MTFASDKKTEDDFSDYKELVRAADNINSQLVAWNGRFNTLLTRVDTPRQAELSVKRDAFIGQLRTTLGI